MTQDTSESALQGAYLADRCVQELSVFQAELVLAGSGIPDIIVAHACPQRHIDLLPLHDRTLWGLIE